MHLAFSKLSEQLSIYNMRVKISSLLVQRSAVMIKWFLHLDSAIHIPNKLSDQFSYLLYHYSKQPFPLLSYRIKAIFNLFSFTSARWCIFLQVLSFPSISHTSHHLPLMSILFHISTSPSLQPRPSALMLASCNSFLIHTPPIFLSSIHSVTPE